VSVYFREKNFDLTSTTFAAFFLETTTPLGNQVASLPKFWASPDLTFITRQKVGGVSSHEPKAGFSP
jgi:hypothetical protein